MCVGIDCLIYLNLKQEGFSTSTLIFIGVEILKTEFKTDYF